MYDSQPSFQAASDVMKAEMCLPWKQLEVGKTHNLDSELRVTL